MPLNLRKPAVAGSFYPGSKEPLKVALDNLVEFQIQNATPTGKLLGFVVPHAGYVYSGKTAAMAYSQLKGFKGRRFVLIGPNHASFPPYSAIYPSGQWNTPLGSVSIDEKTSASIANNCLTARLDANAHSHEHSVEVQLPFLQYMLGNDISITTIIMGMQGPNEAHQLAEAILKLQDDFILISSSDLNHYESLELTNQKDHALIDAITSLDIDRFYMTLEEHEVSACGYGPIAVLMEYTKAKAGALSLLGHTTSFDFSGDSKNVVGYCSFISSKPL